MWKVVGGADTDEAAAREPCELIAMLLSTAALEVLVLLDRLQLVAQHLLERELCLRAASLAERLQFALRVVAYGLRAGGHRHRAQPLLRREHVRL